MSAMSLPGARRVALLSSKRSLAPVEPPAQSIYVTAMLLLQSRGDTIWLASTDHMAEGLYPGMHSDDGWTTEAEIDGTIGAWRDGSGGSFLWLAQATQANKPQWTKRINYFLETDAVNLLPSETVVTTLDAISAGGLSMTKLAPSSAPEDHVVIHASTSSGPVGHTWTYSILAKAGEIGILDVRTQTDGHVVVFDLNSGTIPYTSAGIIGSSMQQTEEDGTVWRCTFSVFMTGEFGLSLWPRDVHDLGRVYSGDDVSGLYVAQDQAELYVMGSPSRYQRVGATPTDYDQDGFPAFVNFDETAFMTAVLPPVEYADATVIYSLPNGQWTLPVQNLSEAFTVGPDTRLYAVIICKTEPDAETLGIYQTMMEQLAGL